MVHEALQDPYGRYNLDNGIILYGLTYDDVGRGYIDGIDNDGDGGIDEGIDKGIDEPGEIWYDGIDNDSDGDIDEYDEIGDQWLDRFGSNFSSWNQPKGGFGEYSFDSDGNIIFDYAAAEGMTHFGTSAKYIDAVKKAKLKPENSHDLSMLKSMMSTGSPLVPESFDYVYENIKSDLHLASISGGTDIVGCFVLGNPIGPVWRGEIQTRALGLAVDVFDEFGNSLQEEAGDLVCTKPFPSMPVGFWADEDGEKYKSAYFKNYPNVWCHGDWVELTERGGMVIYGRSDATLNPGGVRIGTAEIYRQVEQFDEVIEGLCIGQIWDGDTRVVLFVVMRDGSTLTDVLQDAIRLRIRKNCTPRHVPEIIISVPDIPRTKSGKITELAVRNIIEGRPIKNAEVSSRENPTNSAPILSATSIEYIIAVITPLHSSNLFFDVFIFFKSYTRLFGESVGFAIKRLSCEYNYSESIYRTARIRYY